MLILIAESKTMDGRQKMIPSDIWETHKPVGEDLAVQIMDGLQRLSQPELISETGFSASLAAKLRQMIYEFPNKALGQKAIEAYNGVVFKAFDYETLNDNEKFLCERNVRIISSLYGFLRPDDIIKPYRLDFTTKVAPNGAPLNSFWKKDTTIQLVKAIREEGHSELLNLLPADAAKCVDWKIIKRFCKVWKIDFVEVAEGNMTKTPAANKLKTMRGKLLNRILRDEIDDVLKLKAIESDDFFCEGTPVYSDHIQFIC